jgi:hypothetical protein
VWFHTLWWYESQRHAVETLLPRLTICNSILFPCWTEQGAAAPGQPHDHQEKQSLVCSGWSWWAMACYRLGILSAFWLSDSFNLWWVYGDICPLYVEELL